MSKRLNECYKTILESWSMEVGPEGEVSLVNPETKDKEPMLVKGRRLMLPTREFLRMEDRSAYQPFHPLSENLARGQSVIVKAMLRNMHKLIIWNLYELTGAYMEVACVREYQKNLPAVWNNFFQATKDADEKTLETYRRILKAGCDDHKRLVSVFLKNGGKLDGKKFSRVCHVGFSWFDDIDSQLVFGVKLRKKDVTVIKAVLRQVLPGIGEQDYYSAGTNTDVAPYFVSMLKSWAKIAHDFNDAIAMAAVMETNCRTIPVDYLDTLSELPTYYRDVPPLEGNEGEAQKGAAKDDSTTGSMPPWDTEKPAARPVAAKPAQPVGGLDFRNPFGVQQPTAGMIPQQPMYPQMGMMQQPGMPQPMYPQQTQQHSMGLGAMVAHQPNMYSPQMQMGMMPGQNQMQQFSQFPQQQMNGYQGQPNFNAVPNMNGYPAGNNVPGYGVPTGQPQSQGTL